MSPADVRNAFYAQDWFFVVGKLDIHGHIIKCLFFKLWRDQASAADTPMHRTDLSLLELVGDALQSDVAHGECADPLLVLYDGSGGLRVNRTAAVSCGLTPSDLDVLFLVLGELTGSE
jgi:hypothetical protein